METWTQSLGNLDMMHKRQWVGIWYGNKLI